MPSSVSPANPTQVLPKSLSTAFSASRDWTVDSNSYAGGEFQASLPQTYDPGGTGTVQPFQNPRRSWQLTKRLTSAQWSQLLAFWKSVGGCQNEFWFYDPYETVPQFFYDSGGSANAGRFAVRFNSDLTMALTLGRPAQVNIVLLE